MTPLLALGGKLLDKMFPDPVERAEAEARLRAADQQGDLKQLEISLSAILAEAQSENPIVSTARPAFMWVFYLVIVTLGVITPVIGVWYPAGMETFYANVAKGFAAIPAEMWATFTVGYLGYTGAREYGKHKKRSAMKIEETPLDFLRSFTK